VGVISRAARSCATHRFVKLVGLPTEQQVRVEWLEVAAAVAA